MQEWVVAVKEALGLDTEVDVDLILDVAKDAAHGVQRPAAPVSTYLLGLAVAGGADPAQAAAPFRSWPTVGPHRIREPDWPTARRLARQASPIGPTGAAGRRRRPGYWRRRPSP